MSYRPDTSRPKPCPEMKADGTCDACRGSRGCIYPKEFEMVRIDASLANEATTTSASDGSIYESVSRRADPEGHAEALAQIDEVLGRAPAPSRNAAPLDAGGIGANKLEAMAKEMPDECFLKGSGVLKLIAAIRHLERAQQSVCGNEDAALHGFDRESLEAIVDGLESGYDKTVDVGGSPLDGIEINLIESTTAVAARFIRAALTQQSAAPSRDALDKAWNFGLHADHHGYADLLAAQAAHAGADTERLAIEAAAKQIYAAFPGADAHPWVEWGNSDKQEEARAQARAALAATEKKGQK